MNIFGANWRTTIAGLIAAGFQAYRDGAFTDPTDWHKWLVPVALAIFGYLVKDKNVTGGNKQQDINGATVPAGQQNLVDATLKATPTDKLTPEQNSIKKSILPLGMVLIFALIALSVGGCADQTYIRAGTAAAVAATIQYVVPTAQKGTVARNCVKASQIYSTVSGGQIPDGAQLRLVLDRVIPENPGKIMAETVLVSFYSGKVYPQIKDKVPADAFATINEYLLGINDGATPFVGLHWLMQERRR